MKNDFSVSSFGKILAIIFIFTVTCGIGLMFRCGNNPETPMLVDIMVTTNPPNGENLNAHEFYINDSIDICIEVLEKDIIDTIAFGALIDPKEPISESDIEIVRDSIRTGNSIGYKNHFPIRIGRPCTVLLVAIACSRGIYDFDTLRMKIVEQPDSNKAPTIRLEPTHKYAAPSLPCSLKVIVKDAEPWQKESLSIQIPDESIKIIDSALCVYKPAKGVTSGSKSFSIIVRDNGNPRKSDTAHVTIAILDDGEVLPPPQNVRVVQRLIDSVTIVWDIDSLADGYRIYRSHTLNGDSADTFETTTPWFIDTTSKIYFYRIAAVNFFGPSESKTMVFGCDTVHYALSVGFLDSASTASENESIHSIKVHASQKAKKDVLIHVSAIGITANQEDFSLISPYTIMKSGDSVAAINLKITNDTLDEDPETFMVTLDSVSSGYIAGQIQHTVTILDNDTFYTVTYDDNGADSGKVPVDAKRYKTGDTVRIALNSGGLMKKGYTFIGWDTMATGNIGTPFVPGDTFVMKRKDIVLFAQWTAAMTYTITYYGNGSTGGEVPLDNNKYPAGAKATILNQGMLVKQGYSFTAWNTKADGAGKSYKADTAIFIGAANDTFYAQWAINRSTVTFDARGGSTVESQTVNYGDTAKEPIPPSKTGYTFVGWCKDSLCANAWVFAKDTVMSNITLYAQWKIKQYKVAYDGNGNTGGVVPIDSVTYDSGAIATVLANTGNLVRTGYTFIGWNSKEDGFGTGYNAGSTIPMKSSVTLYAKWTTKPIYTLAYIGNGNTGGTVPDAVTSDSGGKVAVAGKGTLEKTNYTLTCWNTLANGTGTDYSPDSTFIMPAADDTLYAKWTINQFTVSFDAQGGSAVDSQKVNYGSKATAPTPPTKSGYRLEGWYKESECLNVWSFSTDAVTANRTLYAKWTQVYTVTYNGNEQTSGTPPTDANTYTNGQTVTVLDNTGSLSRSGYAFVCWNTNAAGTGANRIPGETFSMGSVNVTLYAKWTPAYTVIFDGQGATIPASPTTKTVVSPATTINALPTPPSKTGYLFGGWYTAINGGGTEFTASSVVTANDTVYAKWNTYVYTISFDGQAATVAANPTTKMVSSPATTIDALPTPPTKTGYTFGGWYTAIDGGGTEFTASSVVNANDTVYAKWNPYEYIISFDGQGATVAADPTTKTISSPATTIDALPTPPTKTGYTFGGWYTAINGGGTELTASTVVTATDTVYARWNSSIYFDGQGATTPANPTIKIVTPPATTIDVLPAQPTRTGYSFSGWYTAINGGGTEFTISSVVTVSDTVYAKWTANTYNVAFDKNDAGATGTMNPQPIVFGSSANLTANGFTKTGYSFAGWATSAGGSVVYNNQASYAMATEGATLYAKWIITDIDGNIYTEVTIGSQVWMVENLKTRRYRDGTAIPRVTDNAAWGALTTPGYCWYGNDSATYNAAYGILYNWYTAADSRKIAPAGWHVPTDAEWTELENYLIANGYNYDGTTTGNKIAKSMAAKMNWNTSTITGAPGNDLSLNNRSGFSAFPGGYRNYDGTFYYIGSYGPWWSATEYGATLAWSRTLIYHYANLYRNTNDKRFGFSVRCVRD